MNQNLRSVTTVAAILLSAATTSLKAYDLPELPPIPAISAPAAAGSMPMGSAASFAEVKMDFPIETNGPFQPTWPSIAGTVPGNGTPAWLRQAKFGIWFHYGPQAALQSGDWSAQHMYQQGSWAYSTHTNLFGHPTTNGYKDVLKAWNPTNYSPAGMAQLFYNAGARFVLVQGVHHDNFDTWNSRYNPWNMMNFGAKRDTMAEWTNALHNLGMKMGVAFHHEYSWWFTQPDFLSDSSGTYAGVPYDAVTTATNTAGKWWEPYDTRRLYNIDLNKYQGFSTPNQGYWNPGSGILTNDLEYANWYATQWALRMLDVVENYSPDFIYTDGNSTQPFSGYATGTGYKCDAMQRVIAHFYNRTLERHGQLDTLAVVKFHSGDRIGTTYEGNFSSTIKSDQPWFAEFAIGDWFWRPGISYDTGGTVVARLLEAVSRDGCMMVNIPNRPDGALDSGASNMLVSVGQWMNIHSEGIYGSHAWAKYGEDSFRYTVGTNGCLYAYYMSVPSAGTVLTIPSLATGSTLLAGTITNVSMLGSASALAWSQTSTGLVVTCPATMPAIPAGTAICFKVGPASAIGTTIPTGVIALPGTNRISLAWDYPSTAATFNVKRSTTQGGSYTTIATNLTSLAFADTNVSPATLYFYVVTAVDAGGESVNSAETSASLAGAPSGNWLTEDVGAVGAAGSFNLSEGTFTVQGSGNDIWETADEFRYVFQALNGDCAITARVLNMQNTAGWAKAGLMIRETLDPASKYVINFMSPVNGTALQQRQATGGSASGVSNNTGRAAPYWLRLVRTNDTFTAFISADGTNWIQSGTTTVAMNACVYVGPAVCSHNDGTLCQAQFDNVTFSISTYRPIAAPLPPLIHRYSFDETSGTNAADSVGGLTATLRGGASFDGTGKVVLNGTNSYVNLGGGLLSGLTNATFEGWFSYSVPNNNVHLFSFDDGTGTGTQNGGAWNGNYIRYNINNGIATVEIPNKGNPYNTGNAGDGKVAGATTLSQNTLHHVVFVYDSASGVESLYLDGVLDGTASGTVAPINSIFNTRGTLGASPWSAWGDPYLKGAISEFRIYSGALSQSDISTSHMVGQDVLLTTNVTLNVSQGGGGITFSWPVAASGFTLESSPTLGSGAVWTPVDGASQIIGSNNQVTVPATNAAMFFRLLR